VFAVTASSFFDSICGQHLPAQHTQPGHWVFIFTLKEPTLKKIVTSGKVFLLFLLALGSTLGTADAAKASTDTEWLARVYNDVLFRAPNQQELSAFIDSNGSLQNGYDRFTVAFAILASAEGETDVLGGNPGIVRGWFQLLLGRNPSSNEVTTLLQQFPMPTGLPDFAMLAYLIGGPAYANEFSAYAIAQNPSSANCGGNVALIDQIYQVYLARNPNTTELNFALGLLTNGVNQQEIALYVSNDADIHVGNQTAEYFNDVVVGAYQRFLRRAPGAQELITMSIALAQNGINEELYAVLMASDEYSSGHISTINPAVQLPAVQALQTISALIATPPLNPALPLSLQPSVAQAAADASASTLRQEVSGLQGQLTIANTSVSQLQNQVSVAQGQLAAANGTISQVQGQNSQLQSQVSGLQTSLNAANANLAIQTQTITDLANTLFGVAPTQDVAAAEQSDAQAKVSQAAAQVGANATLVQKAQSNLSLGNTAFAAGDYSTAVKTFRLAYLQAGNAMR
jgi:hypothetical protein